MNLKLYLQKKLEKTIKTVWPETADKNFEIEINYPPDIKFGEYTSNVALKLAPLVRQSAIEIANQIKDKIGKLPAFSGVEVVQPGFLNFYLDKKWLARQLPLILMEKEKYGRSDFGRGKKVQVEFVSANPTGPIHVGNGRGGFMGDALANILQYAGYRVQREYYVNDVGKQVGILAESVLRRYWQHQGIKIEYPEYCYQGKYIEELAAKLFLPNYKLNHVHKLEEVRDKIKGRILQKMIGNVKRLLEKKLKIKYDRWFSEKSLYNSGEVDRVIQFLKSQHWLYKSEGAIWLKTKEFGDDKDRVLIKADGEPVYFLSDIAYHWNKFTKRGFDKVIDIWGADHHGYMGRMQAAMKIIGHSGKLDILIVQLVRLVSRGQEVRMSKRSGTFITLEELVDQVGLDAARFFFLMHDFNTHMDFDLDLAKKKSKDNPVFYVQYAHARICSIIKKAKILIQGKSKKKLHKVKLPPSNQSADLEPSEVILIKELLKWPELVVDIAGNYQVNKLPFYAIDLATNFHDFYTKCRVIDGGKVNERRYQIIQASQIVLQNCLAAMGVDAPERM
ncbi:MAG: arginine--tRNA ligase [Patescibacteria group bacterium]|jgi:arginyl-tRNA synthetase